MRLIANKQKSTLNRSRSSKLYTFRGHFTFIWFIYKTHTHISVLQFIVRFTVSRHVFSLIGLKRLRTSGFTCKITQDVYIHVRKRASYITEILGYRNL